MRVDIDQRGIRRLIRERPGLYPAMNYHAGRAMTFAFALAPVGSGPPRGKGGAGGEYKRRMFHAEARDNAWASAYYGSHSYKGWWVEFGTIHNRAHGTLQRAARLAGMRVGQVAIPGKGGIFGGGHL